MAYGFYPQMYQPQQAQTSRIWVSGEAGARAYLVGPNSSVDLWDSEAPVIYVKSADASGMPSMKIVDYVAREATMLPKAAEQINPDDFVKRSDFDAFEKKVEKQLKKLAARSEDDDE